MKSISCKKKIADKSYMEVKAMFKFYRIYRVLSKLFILASVLFFAVQSISAQNPDLALTDAERDSVLKNYDQIFPIWG